MSRATNARYDAGYDGIERTHEEYIAHDPFRGKLYRWYMDEAGTEFHMDKVDGKRVCYFAITEDGDGV